MNVGNIYRDKTLNDISENNVGETLRLAGWVENIRDHGGVSFVDLRDMYGVMQVVMRDTKLLEGISKEDCISVEGVVEHRDEETYNPKIPTGTIELEAHKVEVLGRVYRQLPFEIMTSKETREDDVTKLGLTLPCVVKPCCGGSSIGVTIVRDAAEFKAALDEAFKWEDHLIIEEYVKGREFSVGVLEGKALPVIEIAPIQGFYDYKNKYKAGSAVETCPADLPEEISAKMRRYAERVAEVIGLDTYSRSDFLLDENNQIYCLEANTLPGMTPTSLLPQEAAVIGINFNELCEKLIEISLRKYEG